jgi:iron complex outermembrane receptor protein
MLSYAHKSRFPTLRDRYSYKAGRALPNPALEPEHADTWTAGYSRGFGAATMTQVDVFRSLVTDAIENIFFLSPLCSGGGRGAAGSCQQAANVGSETRAGINVTLRSTAIPRLTVDANYGYLHRVTRGTGTFPTGTPVHKAMATGTLRLGHAATALVTLRHQSGAVGMSDNGLPLPANAFSTVDVGGMVPIGAGLRLQAGVKNVFDANYYYWEGFPEAGRNAYAMLRYRF